MSSTQTNVAKLCLDLDRKVIEYGEAVAVRAEAEATYKAEFAKRKLRARADGAKSIAEAETIADAEDFMKDLHMRHLITEGAADALRKAIAALHTRIDYGRSVIATEREQDRLHSQGVGGAS